MRKKPVLVIMAAGMGSRYGGLKQIDPVDEHGNLIIDARGVCCVDENGMLKKITERTRIEKHGEQAEYTEDGGRSWEALPEGTAVSMNLWGFTPAIFGELKKRFMPFLEQGLRTDSQKCEYFLPFVVDELLREGRADVKVLFSADSWYGVTYKEDREKVTAAICGFKKAGLYPERLWEAD